ncbi:TSCPD domain-containing protein [Micromonospora narathiwatensis]|uniref:TSCPD domain-containing protein n=1 Tax=Micromonospora narathiwatensis TaxID=299146 RepID=UPI000B877B78|nr:hypothetical protein [Micromonospora narathiwatensis]
MKEHPTMAELGRTRIPAPRQTAGTTTEFVLDGIPGRLVTAAAADLLAHVELRVDKHGSTLAGLTDALSTAITTGLHAGAPVSEFVAELRHTRYAPAGRTGDPDVPEATSLGDYLARRLAFASDEVRGRGV